MTETGKDSKGGNQSVTVKLAGGIYGLPIECVEAIIPWEPLTRLPRMPRFLSGILSVRGSVLPILDLRTRLGLEAPAPTTASRIFILQAGETRFGGIVDGVRGVEWIPENRVEQTIPFATAEGDEFMTGIANLENGMVILLNLDYLLKENEKKQVAKWNCNVSDSGIRAKVA